MKHHHYLSIGATFLCALFIAVMPFGNGVAHATSPITISTCTQLQNIGATSTEPTNGSYVLTQNIDCSATATWNPNGSGGYYGFSPIPDFTGTFNGAGYSITSLYISTTTSNVGLFSTLDATSTVQNLTLSGGSVTGAEYVGGLVGEMLATSTIQNVTISMSVTDTGGYLGGLAGYGNSANATIASSSASSTINASQNNTNYIGGLVGDMLGTISNSFASAPVTATGTSDEYIGDLAGYTSGAVSNSYAIGNVNVSGGSDSYVGGLIGDANATTTNTYETGSVTVGGSYDDEIGGLIGGQNQAGAIASSSASGAVNVTGPNGEYLGGFMGDSYGAISNSYETGTLTGTTTSEYVGGFDGYQDSSGPITECYETGNIVSGGPYTVGGFVGAGDATISKSFATGNVSLSGVSYAEYAGGFAGYLEAPVDDDYATGNISIPANVGSNVYYIGGFEGYGGASVTNSYSTGTIIGNNSYNDIGGFIGYNDYPLVNSYSTGGGTALMSTTTGTVGYFLGENTATLTNVADYSQGVPAIGDNHPTSGSVALLATHGYGTDESTLSNFYSTTEPVYAQATTTAWDFNTIWETHPNTFPTFQWYSGVSPTFTITASAGTGGVINNAGPLIVQEGANQTYTITPNSGYTISNVLIDGTSIGAVSTYTFSNVTASHTISATFTQTQPASGGGGSGSTSIPTYGCTDPKASNYNDLAVNVPSLCRYAATPVTATTTPPIATTTPSCTAQVYPTEPIKPGAQNDPAQVMLLQQYLNTYGNTDLPVDGVYSPQDEAAVITWQEQHAAVVLAPWGITKGTGYIYKTSLQEFKDLFLSECGGTAQSSTTQPILVRDLYLGMSGSDVEALQQTLIAKMIGPAAQALAKHGATGYFGELTKAALIEFQKSAGIVPAVGYYGPETQAALSQ